MQDIIEGFLKFRREAFPQRSAPYKQLATNRFVPLADYLHVCATPARLNAAA